MASIHSEQLGAWRRIISVAISTGAVPGGDAFDMRTFSQGIIEATSTHGVPVLTYWTAATSTGTYRLLKTSTGGAVATTIVANSFVKMPAALAGAGWVKLSSSTTGAPKTLPAILLKKT